MNSANLQAYREMLADAVRMAAFDAALRARARGQAVCEIGVGLGPLSLMALKNGARVVYGIEVDADALSIATRLIRAAGFGPDRFIPIEGLSTQLTLPEKVDVIVSETLDSTGVGENTLRYLKDARERFLRPGGVVIPERMTGLVALADPQSWAAEEQWWTRDLLSGLDFAPVAPLLRGRFHVLDVDTEELCSTWIPWLTFNFNSDLRLPRVIPMVIPVARPARVTALAWAFDAILADRVPLSTRSEAPPTHWKQGLWPIPNPLQVVPGEIVYVEMHLNSETVLSQMSLRVVHVTRDKRAAFLELLRRTARGQG